MSESTSMVQYGGFSLEASQKLAGDDKAGYMKLGVGKNIVRFLPPRLGEDFIVLLFQHYIKVDGAERATVFVCPRKMTNGKQRCPACERADALQNSGRVSDQKAAGSFIASKRWLTNVINRKNPDEGPRILAFGKTIKDDLRSIRENEVAGGDFTHPEKGFDILIEREGTGKDDTKYKVLPARQSSKLNADPAVIAEWINRQADLRKMARIPTTEEVCDLFGIPQAEAAGPAPAAKRSVQDDAIEADFTEQQF